VVLAKSKKTPAAARSAAKSGRARTGAASVAAVAYWRNTGEVLVNSGPFVGHTHRYDYFIFGYALQPVGDIPPTQVGGAAK